MKRGVLAVQEVQGLVARAQDGDVHAWEALYRRAYPRLLAYARRRLGPEEAREAVSETMARAVAGMDRFRPTGPGFDGWLFGICRHVVLDAQRAAGRRGYAPPTEGISGEPAPGERLLLDEEYRAVRAAFARLGDADRELLELRVVAGLSAEETAAALGRRSGAVRMAQARTLARLRRHLKEVQG
jgi:RNA polymerase sigma-70 factor (ECF subfamily)